MDRSFYRFVTIHACDGRTERILIARPRLHSMQRGKNYTFRTNICLVSSGHCQVSSKIDNISTVDRRSLSWPSKLPWKWNLSMTQ